MLKRKTDSNDIIINAVDRIKSKSTESLMDCSSQNGECSPQANTTEKIVERHQPPMFCISCSLRFENKEALKEHKNVCPKKNNSVKITQTNSAQHQNQKEEYNIPVLASTNVSSNVFVTQSSNVRSYNCQECGFQATGSGRSKILLKHSKETGHKTDKLHEKCYTCGVVSDNFEELMIHRKNQHREKVQNCHYKNECRFKKRCWYNHLSEISQDDSNLNQRDFHQVKEPLPPDQMALLMEMLTAFQQTKESMKEKPRSQGV